MAQHKPIHRKQQQINHATARNCHISRKRQQPALVYYCDATTTNIVNIFVANEAVIVVFSVRTPPNLYRWFILIVSTTHIIIISSATPTTMARCYVKSTHHRRHRFHCNTLPIIIISAIVKHIAATCECLLIRCSYSRTKQRFVIWKCRLIQDLCLRQTLFGSILAQWQFINIFAITCRIGVLHREIRRRYSRQSIILIVIITTVFIG